MAPMVSALERFHCKLNDRPGDNSRHYSGRNICLLTIPECLLFYIRCSCIWFVWFTKLYLFSLFCFFLVYSFSGKSENAIPHLAEQKINLPWLTLHILKELDFILCYFLPQEGVKKRTKSEYWGSQSFSNLLAFIVLGFKIIKNHMFLIP